jgi:hypothetical protein
LVCSFPPNVSLAVFCTPAVASEAVLPMPLVAPETASLFARELGSTDSTE